MSLNHFNFAQNGNSICVFAPDEIQMNKIPMKLVCFQDFRASSSSFVADACTIITNQTHAAESMRHPAS